MKGFTKKTCLISVLAFTSSVLANPAVLTWQGTVPSTTGSGGLIITGAAGSLDNLSGKLSPNTDGTFTSTLIKVEARDYSSAPTIGDLEDAIWKVDNATVTYGGEGIPAAVLEVKLDTTVTAIGGTYGAASAGHDTISVQISQTADLSAEGIGGSVAEATVTLSITSA